MSVSRAPVSPPVSPSSTRPPLKIKLANITKNVALFPTLGAATGLISTTGFSSLAHLTTHASGPLGPVLADAALTGTALGTTIGIASLFIAGGTELIRSILAYREPIREAAYQLIFEDALKLGRDLLKAFGGAAVGASIFQGTSSLWNTYSSWIVKEASSETSLYDKATIFSDWWPAISGSLIGFSITFLLLNEIGRRHHHASEHHPIFSWSAAILGLSGIATLIIGAATSFAETMNSF